MSRCFPFPPPGYEKKPTIEDPDLLKKEKRKEKKHKKEKKDKEKREKDKSEGKHKDKKDKKDKHRDKKKEKKSKSSIPPDDNKKIHNQLEGGYTYNGEKVHPNDTTSTRSGSSSDKKPSLHFQKNEESNKEIISSNDKKSPLQFHGQNGEFEVKNRIRKTNDSENIKFVQELDRRIRDEEKGTASHQFVVEGRNNTLNNQFYVEGRNNSFNKTEIRKTDGRQTGLEEVGFGGNPSFHNRINGKTPPPPLPPPPRIEQKEKMLGKESDDKRGDKRKHKDRDKQRQSKDKDTEKEKKEKKEEKSKEKSEQKRAEREKNKYIRKNEASSVPIPNNFPARSLENSEGSFKKRKDMEANGVVSHENELRPNKMARISSNIPLENGRRLDPFQNPGSSLLDKQTASQGAPPNNFKVGSKSQKVNGMIDPQPMPVSTKTPPISGFNHIPSKPSPNKSPPVINNHVSAQFPPVPTAKPPPPPPPIVPNHIAARSPTPKPPPLFSNHITTQSPPLSATPPQSTTTKPPVSRPKPPPAAVNKAAPPPPPPAAVNKVAPPPPPPAAVNKAAPPPPPLPKKKPPHPDTKYLNQILSVPKLDEWCGFDDQEWLFSSKKDDVCSKKTTMEDHLEVWSEAKHIESADICALPYVIPY